MKSQVREGLDVYKVLGVKGMEGELIVSYYPFRNTSEITEQAAELFDGDKRAPLVRFGVEQACAQLKSWNLLNNGEPIPLEPDVVAVHVPDDVLEDIGDAIRKDKELGKKKGTRTYGK
jgi:hypothetical protein